MKDVYQANEGLDCCITNLVVFKLDNFLKLTHSEMRKAGMLGKFREESQKCLRAVIAFYDLAMKSPRAAQIALEKLKTRELLKEQSPDELKLALIEATRVIRESKVIYQDYGPEFAFKVSKFCIRSLFVVEEAVEQKLQQERRPFKGVLKQKEEVGEESCATADRRSVSWTEHVTMR